MLGSQLNLISESDTCISNEQEIKERDSVRPTSYKSDGTFRNNTVINLELKLTFKLENKIRKINAFDYQIRILWHKYK